MPITMKDLKELVVGVIVTKTTSVKPDEDYTGTPKTLHARIKIDNVPLMAVIEKAVSGAIIQAAPGWRKRFTSLKHGQTVDIEFKAPGVTIKTPEEMVAEYTLAFMKAGLPKEEAETLAKKAVYEPEVIS